MTTRTETIFAKGFKNYTAGQTIKVRLCGETETRQATVIKAEHSEALARKPGGGKVRMPQTMVIVEIQE